MNVVLPVIGHSIVHSTVILLIACGLCCGWKVFRHGQASELMRTTTLLASSLSLIALLPIPNYTTCAAIRVNDWLAEFRAPAAIATETSRELGGVNDAAIGMPRFGFTYPLADQTSNT